MAVDASPLPENPPDPTPPSFSFDPVPLTQTCASSTIEWTYDGPAARDVSLFIANTTIPHLGEDDLNFEPLPSGVVKAAREQFVWEPSGYAPGWYILEASGRDFSAQSLPFFIDACDTSQSAPSPPSTATTVSPYSWLQTNHISPTAMTSAIPGWPQTLPVDTPNAGNKNAAVVAGSIIAAVAVLITLVVVFLCFRNAMCRRSRAARSLPPRDKRPYRSARWLGLSSSHSSLQADSTLAVREHVKPRLSVIEMPRPAVPRLEPNRRQPSMYIPSPVATNASQPSFHSSITKREDSAISLEPNRRQPSVYIPSPIAANKSFGDSATKRGDSPTSLASPYKTRKPVPPLDLVEATEGRSRGPGYEGQGEMSPELNSAVPSSATSKMYRTRDSGMSLQTQVTADREEAWRARASSIIDPHQFGAMKTMHTVVPDVPALPANLDY